MWQHVIQDKAVEKNSKRTRPTNSGRSGMLCKLRYIEFKSFASLNANNFCKKWGNRLILGEKSAHNSSLQEYTF